MTLAAALLTVALALPTPWYRPGRSPETAEQHRDRVAMIVEEAVAVTERPPDGWTGSGVDLAAAVLAVTYAESRWALEVHAGRVRGDDGRSCGLGQLWGRCSTVGVSREQTRAHLTAVAEVLVKSAVQCQMTRPSHLHVRRLLTAYGTGRTCQPASWSRPRAALWARFRRAGEAILATDNRSSKPQD